VFSMTVCLCWVFALLSSTGSPQQFLDQSQAPLLFKLCIICPGEIFLQTIISFSGTFDWFYQVSLAENSNLSVQAAAMPLLKT